MATLTPEQIRAAEALMGKGYCVELRPVKDDIRVIKVIREQVKTK